MTITHEVDPCFQSLIGHPRAQIRPCAPDGDMAAYRAALDAPMLDAPGEPVADVRSLTIGSVPARIYRPERGNAAVPVIVFLHGGGFVAGSLDTHDALCRALCRVTGMAVLSVEYRLAPEHRHPAALQDCLAVLRWLAREGEAHGLRPDRVALCGDSAGGYLAVLAALAARDEGLRLGVLHIALFYPVVDPRCDTKSMERFSDGFVLTREALRWFWDCLADPSEVRTGLSLLSKNLSGLPPVSIVTAQFDPLSDEGALLALRLRAAGVAAQLRCFPGMIHGFVSLPHVTPVADIAIRHLGDAMAESMRAATG